MFLGPDEEMTVGRYCFKGVMPLLMLALFYLNYLHLVPRMIRHENRMNFYLANFLLLILACVLMQTFRHWEYQLMPHEGWMGRHVHHSPALLFQAFAVLRDAFNFILAIVLAYSIRMTSHAHQLSQERQEAEVARRDAELKGLRLQISPHFLLNTLNNIFALTSISAERAQSAILQLSQMLRHMLYDNQEKMVSLKSEAEFIRSYVNLMKLRLASNVKVTTDFNIPEDADAMVAPLLFISLVENAFKHGVSSTEPSTISINISYENEEIHCFIVNTNFPKADNDHSGHGIGLQQVQQRLDNIYKDKYSWTHGIDPSDNLYHSEIILKQ